MEDSLLDCARTNLSKLIGQHIKLIVREKGRPKPAYEGKILSVGKETIVFNCELARTDRPAGRFTFQISDVHGWVVADDVVFPSKRKK